MIMFKEILYTSWGCLGRLHNPDVAYNGPEDKEREYRKEYHSCERFKLLCIFPDEFALRVNILLLIMLLSLILFWVAQCPTPSLPH